MKTQYFTRASIVRGAAALLILPFQMLPIAEGSTQPQDIEVADIARLCVRVNKIGATGIGKVIGTEGETRYEIDGSKLKVYLAPVDRLGEMTVVVDGNYGEIKLHAVIFVDVKNDAESEVEVSPYIFSAIAAGGGAGMEQYILTLTGGKFHHGDEELNFAQVKEAVLDTSKFVYLQFANAFHLPCFVVDAEGRQSVEFTSSFVIGGEAHIERVIINEQEQIDVDNVQLLRINEDGGVAFGEGIATGEYAFAHGVSAMDETFSFECHKLTDEEREAVRNVTGIDYEYCDFGDNIDDGYGSSAVIYADEEFTQEVARVKLARYVGDGVESADYFMLMSGSLEDGVEYYGRYEPTASGLYSHAEGYETNASGDYSHAEGERTTASGDYSHAEGYETTASSDYSHAEGYETTASGNFSHAEGYGTTASGDSSHAEGDGTTASGDYSHAEGIATTTTSDSQHAQGQFNNADEFEDEHGAFMHGCGTGDDARKNAFAIAEDGKVYVIGLGGYDGTNHTEALSLQEIFGASIIQAATNTLVNNYNVPNLTPEQVTQAYNAVVAGKSVTITDATGNYHLGVTQADVLNGDIAISLIYLNVMLLTYEISGSTVDVQFKNL